MILASIGTDAALQWPEWWRLLTFRAGYNASVVMTGAGLLGLAAGVIGAFALLRRRSLVADALSHATLPGLAIAFLISASIFGSASGPILLLGAAATGLLAMACIHLITRHTRLHEDAAIAIALSVFFGMGIILLGVIQSHGGAQGGLKGYVYGHAASMLAEEAWLSGAIAAIAVLAALLFHKELTLASFDEAFARVGGWRVDVLDALLLALVTIVTVAGLRSVGAILIVAMLIIPPVTARLWTSRASLMLLLSGALGALSALLGVTISAQIANAPTGPVIVLVAGAAFLVSLFASPQRGLFAVGLRLFRLRLRIAQDHALQRLLAPRSRARRTVDSPFILTLLRLRGLARRSAGAFVLTPVGRARAERVARNHRLWTQYLVSRADVAPSHVDWSVDQVEHVLSPELITQLERELARAEGEQA